MRHDDVLFWKYDWHAVTEHQKQSLRKAVDKLQKDDFGSASIDELSARFCEQFSINVPKLNRNDISVSQKEVDIDVSGDHRRIFRDRGPHYVKGTEISVSVPFTGDPEMFSVKPNRWTTVIPRGRVSGQNVIFTISGADLEADDVKVEIERRVDEIEEWLGFQEGSVGNFPKELAQVAVSSLNARKAKLDADNDLISGLGYKVE